MNPTEERHTRDLEQRLAEAKATIGALLPRQIAVAVDLPKPIASDALIDVVARPLSRSSPGGELSRAKPRGSDARHSVGVAGTLNDRRW
jgi:hypothetical protein